METAAAPADAPATDAAPTSPETATGTLFAGDSPAGEDTSTASTSPTGEIPEWASQAFGDSAKDHAAMLSNFKDPSGLLKSMKDNMTAARSKPTGFQIPGEDSTPEEVAAFREAFGVPETAEGYSLGEPPEGMPEGLWNSEAANEFSSLAHELNLPKGSAEKIVGFQVEMQKKALAAHQETIAAEAGQLKTDWGDKYDANKALMFEAAKAKGIDPTTHPAFAHADVAKAFAEFGSALFAEDSAGGGVGGGGNRWGDAKAEYRAIQDPNSGHQHAAGLAANSGPAFRAAIEYQMELARKISAEEQAAKKSG